jgi:nitrogen fixation/metabolism regulation signal transduction histidine kinase
MNKRNLTVGGKLWAIALPIVLTLLTASIVSQQMASNALHQALATVESHDSRIQTVLRWRGMVESAVQALIARALATDASLSNSLGQLIEAAAINSRGLHDQIAAVADTPSERDAMAEIIEARKRADALGELIEEVLKLGDSAMFTALVEQQIKPAAAQYIGALDKFVALQEALRDEARVKSLSHARQVNQAGWIAMAVVAGSSLILFGWLARSITRPLGDAVQAARVIAGGDLRRQRLDSGRTDEIGQLMKAMSEMSHRLHSVVSEVRQGVQSVGTASVQIDGDNQDLSTRTEHMAASLQQTASSIEEI